MNLTKIPKYSYRWYLEQFSYRNFHIFTCILVNSAFHVFSKKIPEIRRCQRQSNSYRTQT